MQACGLCGGGAVLWVSDSLQSHTLSNTCVCIYIHSVFPCFCLDVPRGISARTALLRHALGGIYYRMSARIRRARWMHRHTRGTSVSQTCVKPTTLATRMRCVLGTKALKGFNVCLILAACVVSTRYAISMHCTPIQPAPAS